MKKIATILLAMLMAFGLSGCALLELFQSKDNVVDLGDGENSVTWTLVHNNNKYSTVESAYFEFDKDSFKYYEDGELKKEGTHRITYSGVENTICPLHILVRMIAVCLFLTIWNVTRKIQKTTCINLRL